MSDEIGTYSFLPWLRVGIANHIAAADDDATVKSRATIPVDLTLTGAPVEGDTALTATVSRHVEMVGPGDIVGISQKAIIRIEPGHWITNFEPNYLPFVEFYEEDFPWRYTPAAPDTAKHRLRPWIALLVVKEDEFEELAAVSSRPLPAVEITGDPAKVFPPADQLWAWAHVHVNRDLIRQDGVVEAADIEAARGRFETLLRQNPDNAYSRLIAPRRLEPDQGYHALLVPSFETGRLAGLGLDEARANPALFATLSAWADYANRPATSLYPVYHRWTFRTGTVGDFEYLVRLLEPRPPDARLGRRDMDTQTPGSNLPGIAIPELDGVLRLGGALKVPDEALDDQEEAEAKNYELWATRFPQTFQEALARRINLADDYPRQGVPDPIITSPLYGRWHSLTDRLLFEADDSPAPQSDNWVHELNLDPRWRVAAGFGSDVIKEKQEEYMDAAWEQVGDLLAANRRLRLANLAQTTSLVWHTKHLGGTLALATERALTMMAPVQRRVVVGGFNLRHTLSQSTVPRAVMSAPFRRALRPRDHVAKRLGFGGPRGTEQLIARINRGDVSAAPPRVTPADLPTVDAVAGTFQPSGVSPALVNLLRRHRWIKWLVIVLLSLLALLLVLGGVAVAAVLAALAAGAFAFLRRIEQAADRAEAVRPEGSRPETVDRLPTFPGFTLRDPEAPGPAPAPAEGADSPEATRFKAALKDTFTLIDTAAQVSKAPARRPIDIVGLTNAGFHAIDPAVTVPAFTFAGLGFPAQLAAINVELFREAMAYPVIDIPMYKPLLELSDEHFLPNIDKIPPNTITLLETNQRFIEAYMVGVNHEMVRELQWREFPTDLRGTPFRQFWDPSGYIDRQGLDREALREKLRDIPPLHRWSVFSNLGDHDHREQAGDRENEAVLVIKG
jgi:hypothetical protein